MRTHVAMWSIGFAIGFAFGMRDVQADEGHLVHRFTRQQLTDVYYSEGTNVGDLNRDGKPDVVYGPHWYAGPEFTTKHELYSAKAQNRQAYADNFFSWVYDFNGDGWNDVLTGGFPGTPAFVYENPTDKGFDKPWPKHQVFNQVGNEAPQFIHIVGDERPELICTRDGWWGYAMFDPNNGLVPWKFFAVSAEATAPKPFGHGLGVGDVDGDGRLDLLAKDGWYQQPEKLVGDPNQKWAFHRATFARAGGAEMFAYDVDGDGDNDVITSLAAHEYGLAWHEQLRDGDKRVFREHVIMGKTPAENRHGLVFTELHSVQLVDMDGDGLKDIVTGKTYWSHHEKSPMWDAGAVVYWFKLARTKDGVDWIPQLADGEAGIGRQVVVADVNGDKLLDLVVGGMKGCHVLTHAVAKVDEATFQATQPKPRRAMADGLKPEEAAAHMTAPRGFRVQLAAGEPQVHQPIAFAFDARGRVWVAEAYTYPTRAADGEGKDKIVILEDTDGDGTLDKRKVFIEGLNLVSGMELGFGGVWVGAAPYLLFIPDRDGDDVPDLEKGSGLFSGSQPQSVSRDTDQKRVLTPFPKVTPFPKDVPPGATVMLDGFGWHDTHETLNGFIWGPDGWLYGCHGVFTHSKVGKPGTPDAQRTPLNAGIWRFHPKRHEFEVFAWGTSNPWGVDFNEVGEAFCTACVIPHLYHVIQGGRYQRQAGQHFDPYVFDDIKTIADHAHYAGNIGDHAWWGHEPTALASDTDAAGGGHAHAGAMIYLGDQFPAEFRGKLFFSNIHGNRINCDILEPRGSGYVGKHGRDLLFANDHWFRAINLKTGPDGSVYVIDWYDKNACHRVNPLIWDRTNGRVYKLSYVGDGSRQAPVRPRDLTKLSEAELIALQTSNSEWHARMARRLVMERGLSVEGAQTLLKQLGSSSSEREQLRALWLMHASFEVDVEATQLLFANKSPAIRAWAVRLLVENRERTLTPKQLEHVARLAGDPTAAVRLAVASALQRLPIEHRWMVAELLVAHAEVAVDHNLPLMIWYGVEPLVAADPDRAMTLAASSKIPLVASYIVRRAASEAGSLDGVVKAIASERAVERQAMLLGEMLKAFEGRVNVAAPQSWTAAYERLTKSPDAALRDQADQIAVAFGDQRVFGRLRQTLTDPSAALAKRQAALDVLVRGRDAGAAASFRAVLADANLRGAAIRALAAFDEAETPPALLGIYAALNEAERRDAIGTLVARPAYAAKLFDALVQEKLPRTDVHAFHIRQLLSFNDAALTKRIQDVWGDIRESNQDKQAEITQRKKQLGPRQLAAADKGNGRRLFAKGCATCHTLFGEGAKIGPDLTGSNRANLDYILENLVDPSAVLGKDYRMTVLVCGDGRLVSGLIQKETDSALTVRTINDTVVVAKADIEERKLSEQSLMPDRLLDALSLEEVRDLVAYLGSSTQVGLRGPRAPIDVATKRVPGGLEGESLKVLSVTRGAATGQNMSGFTADRWSNDDHLWWTGAKPGDKLELELPIAKDATYSLELVLTKARDYGIVQLALDGKPLGGPIDCFNAPDVITTGVLEFEVGELPTGKHHLSVEVVGAHPNAVKAFMFGLDFVRIRPK